MTINSNSRNNKSDLIEIKYAFEIEIFVFLLKYLSQNMIFLASISY